MQRFGRLLPRLQQARSILGQGPLPVEPVALGLAHIRGFADEANLQKTPLYDFHVEHGGAFNPYKAILKTTTTHFYNGLVAMAIADPLNKLLKSDWIRKLSCISNHHYQPKQLILHLNV